MFERANSVGACREESLYVTCTRVTRSLNWAKVRLRTLSLAARVLGFVTTKPTTRYVLYYEHV